VDSNLHRFVTQRYVRGYRLLPLATLFWIKAAYGAGLFRLPGDARPAVAGRWFFAGLLVALWASYPIRDWYQKKLGKPRQRARDWQLWPVLIGIACLVLATSISQKAGLPFSLPAVVLGLMLASVGFADSPFRQHFLAAAAVCVAEAFLRPLGLPVPIRGVLFDAAIAAVLTIVGVGDHRLLMSASLDEEDDAPEALYEVN